MPDTPNLARLCEFMQQLAHLLDLRPAEPDILDQGGRLLAALVAHDDWLPAAYARTGDGHWAPHGESPAN